MFQIVFLSLGVLVREFRNDEFCKTKCCAVFYPNAIDCNIVPIWYNDDLVSSMCNKTLENAIEFDSVDSYRTLQHTPSTIDSKFLPDPGWAPIPGAKFLHDSCVLNEMVRTEINETAVDAFPSLSGLTCNKDNINITVDIPMVSGNECQDIANIIDNIKGGHLCQDGLLPEHGVDFHVENFDYAKCTSNKVIATLYKGWNTLALDTFIDVAEIPFPENTVVKVFESFDNQVSHHHIELHLIDGKWSSPSVVDTVLKPGVGYMFRLDADFHFSYHVQTKIPSSQRIEHVFYPGWNTFALKKNVQLSFENPLVTFREGHFSENDYIRIERSVSDSTSLSQNEELRMIDNIWMNGRMNEISPTFSPHKGYLVKVKSFIHFVY
jgi:hypothetical protein